MLLSAVCAASFAHGMYITVPLSMGSNQTLWTLMNPENASALSFVGGQVRGCSLPGNVYTHLYDAGVLAEDPLFRFNDVNYRWVANQSWTYTTTVKLAQALRPFHSQSGNFTVSRVEIICSGFRVFSNVSVSLASYPQVSAVVGKTQSQFVQYSFDVTEILAEAVTLALNSHVETEANITVSFESTVLEALRLNASYDIAPFPVDPPYLEDLPARNFVRTEQSSFGWDWGPAFAPVGVDGLVDLRVSVMPQNEVSCIGVEYLWPQVLGRPSPVPNKVFSINITWVLRGSGAICTTTATPCAREIGLNVSSPTLQWLNETWIPTVVTFVPYMEKNVWEGVVSTELFVENPALWYPRGYGDQVLHSLGGSVVLFRAGNNNAAAESTVSWKLPPLAIRAVALITEGNPQQHVETPPMTFAPFDVAHPAFISNHSMYFAINGMPVVAKGSNLIPPSPFPSVSDKERIINDLQSALSANMNMVRVWGGGYYKEDWFYEFCDAHGIMVWQEFVFACAEYPVDSAFLELVRLEVAQQVQRLSRFGCIVLWSANNENDIFDEGAGSVPYHVLYTENVMNVIVKYDTARPLWPSSPSTGFVSGVNRDGLPNGAPLVRDKNATAPGRIPRGDTHYYNYFSCPNFEAYPRTHFASEFGFQSLPWLENIAPVSDSGLGDWSLNSSFMNHRQHHPAGNEEIAQLVVQNFFHNTTNPSLIFNLPFPRVIFLSQLQQVLCIGDQASFYRRGRDYPEYRTMGTLYWQLNQNWQAPSWTSLEYGGEWKILHYAIREVFDQTHLSSFVNSTGGVYAHLTNDNSFPLVDIETRVYVVRYSDGMAVMLPNRISNGTTTNSTSHIPRAPAHAGTFVWSSDVTTVMDFVGVDKCNDVSSCFLWIEVVLGGFAAPNPSLRSRPVFFSSLGSIKWGNNRSDPSEPPLDLVKVNVLTVAFNQATIRVSLGLPMVALYIFIRSAAFPLGQFSENLFHLIPCNSSSASGCAGVEEKVISFINTNGTSIGDESEFERSLVVQTL